jgi:RHS repeat-associated protein
MPMKARYTVIDGSLVAEKRNGVRSLYVPYSLGSTVALLDNTQTQTDQWSYMPYGESKRLKGSNPTPFTFVGEKQYRTDSPSRTYARARVVEPPKARWLTEDAIGLAASGYNLYAYCDDSPSTQADPTGYGPTVEPGCKEIKLIRAAFKIVCNLLATSPCLNKLSPERKGCMNRWCSRSVMLRCGSPRCRIDEDNGGTLCGYTNPSGCVITLCTRKLAAGKCALTGETLLGSVVRNVIHEASHCCSFDDFQHGGANAAVHFIPCYGYFSNPVGTNPAEDLAQCITGTAALKQPLPGYFD